jgi:hypothetical protein
VLDLLMGAAKARFDGKDEVGVGHGLGKVIVSAAIHAAAEIILLAFGGKKDKGSAGKAGIILQFLEDAIAIEFRHHDIAENEIGQYASCCFYAFAAIFGGDGLVVMEAKESGDVPAHFGFIFDDKDFFHGGLEFRD